MVVGRMDWIEARMKVQDQLQWRRQETLMAWTWWWPQSWRKVDGTKSQVKSGTDKTWWQVAKCGEVWRKKKSQGWFLDFWFGKLVDARWCHVVRRQWLGAQKGYRDQKSRVLLWIYSFWGACESSNWRFQASSHRIPIRNLGEEPSERCILGVPCKKKLMKFTGRDTVMQ